MAEKIETKSLEFNHGKALEAWAVNGLKLTQAQMALVAKKKLDPKLEITESAVKEEYVKRGGLLKEDAPRIEEIITATGQKKVVVKRKRQNREDEY